MATGVKDAFTRLENAPKSESHLEELQALHSLDALMPNGEVVDETVHAHTVRELVKSLWQSVSLHYFFLSHRLSRNVERTQS